MLRFDAYSPLPWEKKADGRYWTHITLGEVGAKIPYYSRRGDKLIKRVEIVEEEGLFNDDSLASLPGLPVILKHTKYNLNRDGFKIGSVLSAIAREDNKLLAEAIIDDYRGVELLDRLLAEGKTPEASSGYHLKELKKRENGLLEQIRGDYDHVVAPLMPGLARAGRGITMRFDSLLAEEDAVNDRARQYFVFGDKKDMTEVNDGKDLIIRFDSKDFILKGVNREVEEVVNLYRDRVDSLTSDLEGTEEKIDELEAKITQLESDIASRSDAIDPVVANEIAIRMDSWGEVKSLTNIEPDYKLSKTDILKAGIKAIAPDLNLDSLDDATVSGIWQGIKISNQINPKRESRSTDGFLTQQREDAIVASDSTVNGREKAKKDYENASKRR